MTQQEFIGNPPLSGNHRPLLWLALALTKDSSFPVGEFGAGTESTPFIRGYCNANKRRFVSYDSNKEWAEKWGAEFAEDWNNERLYIDYSVALIDQAPGEYRHTSMAKLKDKATIIVVHDAEPEMNSSYILEGIWHLFKYRIFTKQDKIWTAAVSNFIDLEKYSGIFIGNYKIEV